MSQLSERFDRIEEYILVVLFPIMIITVFVATCIRYLTTFSIPWAEELARYCMVWIGYIGASLGLKRNAHIGVELFVSFVPKSIRPLLDYIRAGVIIVFNILVAYYAFIIIQSQVATEQVSPALNIPMWFAYAAIPVGMVLMIIRCLQATKPNKKPPGQPAQAKEG